jgi:hypothetical protein
MAVMADGPTEIWTAELRRTGMVVFPLLRRPLLRLTLSGPVFLLFVAAVVLPHALKSGGIVRIVGIAVTTAGLIVLCFDIWQLVTQRPVLTVGSSGIRLGRRRFMAWSEIDAIAELDGPPGDRSFAVVPNVHRRKLHLGQQHVRNAAAFRYWLSDLLEEHRRTAASPD